MVSIDDMANSWRRRQAEQQARDAERTAAIRSRLPAVRRLLSERYGARRVVLFGSFARGDANERSDVDLAVAGLEHQGYFPAIAELTGLLDCPVDLVELEQAGPSMLARIELEGVEL